MGSGFRQVKGQCAASLFERDEANNIKYPVCDEDFHCPINAICDPDQELCRCVHGQPLDQVQRGKYWLKYSWMTYQAQILFVESASSTHYVFFALYNAVSLVSVAAQYYPVMTCSSPLIPALILNLASRVAWRPRLSGSMLNALSFVLYILLLLRFRSFLFLLYCKVLPLLVIDMMHRMELRPLIWSLSINSQMIPLACEFHHGLSMSYQRICEGSSLGGRCDENVNCKSWDHVCNNGSCDCLPGSAR